MMMIVKGGHLAGVINYYSRQVTPTKICNFLIRRRGSIELLGSLKGETAGLFVFHHPVLGDPARIPALALQANGHPIASWHTGTLPSPMTAAEFASIPYIEVMMVGHITKYARGWTRSGAPFFAMEAPDSAIRDALDDRAVPWEGGSWTTVDAEYKHDDGTPRIDITRMRNTSTLEIS